MLKASANHEVRLSFCRAWITQSVLWAGQDTPPTVFVARFLYMSQDCYTARLLKSRTAIIVDSDSFAPVQPNLRAVKCQHVLRYAEKKIPAFIHTDTNPRFDPDCCVRLLDDGRSGELGSPGEQ